MEIILPPLLVMLAAVLGVQAFALLAAARMNRAARGLGAWTAAAFLLAAGFGSALLRAAPGWELAGVVANNLCFILAVLLLWHGARRFFGQPPRLAAMALILGTAMAAVLWFRLAMDDVYLRRAALSAAIAIGALLTAREFLRSGERAVRRTARFTAGVFLVLAAAFMARLAVSLLWRPADTSADTGLQLATYAAISLLSMVWTYGLVMLVNQRLLAENAQARDNLRLVFDTHPDAALLIRLDNRTVNDANAGFGRLAGVPVASLRGRPACGLGIWFDPADGERICAALVGGGRCDETAVAVRTASGSRMVCRVAGRGLRLDGLPCAILVFEDVTERARREVAMDRLMRQREAELDRERESARHDGLTGLFNRRALDEHMEVASDTAARTGASLAFLMIDIDFFKRYNDYYGHLAGDDCLRRVAAVLGAVVGRKGDFAARYGGEEFAMVLPGTDASGALATAERVRAAVEGLRLVHAPEVGGRIVTVSVGVAVSRTDGADRPDSVIARADAALYRAKQEGRNRVAFQAEPEPAAGGTGWVRLVWQPEFACGHPLLDRQHRGLFDAANALMRVAMDGGAAAAGLEALEAEVAGHFRDEEAVLRAVGYAGAEAHAASHRELLERLGALRMGLAAGTARTDEVVGFLLYEVVARHLATEDRLFFLALPECQAGGDGSASVSG